jgi:hypothetical protein
LAVRVWDTVGEEQILKGEYKVFAGKMYVEINIFPPVLILPQEMTWNGMVRVSVSSLLEMDERSLSLSTTETSADLL